MDSDSEISALRNQIFTLLLALVVVTGTFAVYMFRQASLTNKDIATAKQEGAEQLIATFNKNQAAINDFEKRLVAYGQMHPEFRPVLVKYGLAPMSAALTGAPAR